MVVNNTLSFQSIPPGVIEDTTDGPRQRYFHDFFNYAGLHRSVWLSATGPATRIDDITVVTGLAAGAGTVDYHVAAEHRRRSNPGHRGPARRRRCAGRHRHRRGRAP